MRDRNWKLPHLETDDDFLYLKQPLSEESFNELLDNVIAEGCLDPILVWHGLIVDGMNRYHICTQLNIRFRIAHRAFQSKEEAYVYICEKELKRQDLIKERYKYLIGRLYHARIEVQEQHHIRAVQSETKNKKTRNSVRSYQKQDISKSIADKLQISRGTVLKYGIFTRCIDNIREKEPAISDKILSGKLKISHENIQKLEKLSSQDLKRLSLTLSNSDINHITYSDIRHRLLWKSVQTTAPVQNTRKEEDINLPIRQMPAYDPDSDLTTLIYTIPTWASSIKRSRQNTDFSKATQSAKEKVRSRLLLLQQAIAEMEMSLKETYCNE